MNKKDFPIPQIIHYCWFGKGKMNKTIKHCMESWVKLLPDYKIMAWNENTFNLNEAPLYVQEAYSMKKWAFVSDYVRLWALDKYGGVYLDTDIEIIRQLDNFRRLQGFSGFSEIKEGDFQIPAAVMGSVKHNPYIRYLLSYYGRKSFIFANGKPDLKANIYIITEMTCDKYPHFRLDNSLQKIPYFEYFPAEYFTPRFKHHNHIPIVTPNTHAIHYHNESWMPWSEKIKIKLMIILSYFHLRRPLRKLAYKLRVLR